MEYILKNYHTPIEGRQSIYPGIAAGIAYHPRLKAVGIDKVIESGGEKREDYTVFCFVRNPYERCASYYHQIGKGFRENNHDNRTSFADACRDVMPCSYYMNSPVDFIGRFETINEDWEKILNKLSIPHQPLPLINQSPKGGYSWKEIYDKHPECYQIVTDYHNRDFEQFGYKKLRQYKASEKEDKKVRLLIKMRKLNPHGTAFSGIYKDTK